MKLYNVYGVRGKLLDTVWANELENLTGDFTIEEEKSRERKRREAFRTCFIDKGNVIISDRFKLLGEYLGISEKEARDLAYEIFYRGCASIEKIKTQKELKG